MDKIRYTTEQIKEFRAKQAIKDIIKNVDWPVVQKMSWKMYQEVKCENRAS